VRRPTKENEWQRITCVRLLFAFIYCFHPSVRFPSSPVRMTIVAFLDEISTIKHTWRAVSVNDKLACLSPSKKCSETFPKWRQRQSFWKIQRKKNGSNEIRNNQEKETFDEPLAWKPSAFDRVPCATLVRTHVRRTRLRRTISHRMIMRAH